MAHRTHAQYLQSRIPTGPTEEPQSFIEREFDLDPTHPATPEIVRELGRLKLFLGIDLRDHPELIAKARAKAERSYQARLQAAEYPPAPALVTHTVYYIRVGEMIKIGTTVDMAGRLRTYPPNAVLLATEPGSYTVESERLAQFRDSLAGRREWFHPSAALIAHVNSLREQPLTAAEMAA